VLRHINNQMARNIEIKARARDIKKQVRIAEKAARQGTTAIDASGLR